MFYRDSSRAIYDEELKFGITDTPFKPCIIYFSIFVSAQLTDLSRHTTITKCRNFAANDREFAQKDKHSEGNKPPGTHFLHIMDYLGRSSEFRKVP